MTGKQQYRAGLGYWVMATATGTVGLGLLAWTLLECMKPDGPMLWLREWSQHPGAYSLLLFGATGLLVLAAALVWWGAQGTLLPVRVEGSLAHLGDVSNWRPGTMCVLRVSGIEYKVRFDPTLRAFLSEHAACTSTVRMALGPFGWVVTLQLMDNG